MSTASSLLLVGCGKMGGALLSRWQQVAPAGIDRFSVIEPSASLSHAKTYPDLASLPASEMFDVIVFAVKPQSLAEILPHYAQRFGTAPLYLSIAAGKTLDFFSQHLGEHARIVRAMPNTPAMVGQGMTALAARSTLAESSRRIASALMEAVGKAVWVEEAQMHAVTALSGSGPAYVFLFLDALTKAGIHIGLSENAARELALQTVHGSAQLAQESHDDFATLRKNVTSPGGTTEAALRVLMQSNALEKLMENAIRAAAERSQELAK